MSWYSICFLCVSVGHDSEPCRNGWTCWYAVWETQGTPCIRWDPDLTQEFEDDILGHVWRSIYSNCSHHRTCVRQAAKLVAALLRVAGVTAGLAECNDKNRDLLRNPMLGNRVWATFLLYKLITILLSLQYGRAVPVLYVSHIQSWCGIFCYMLLSLAIVTVCNYLSCIVCDIRPTLSCC